MPALAAALPFGLSLRDVLAEAVLMGDELHQRNLAAGLLFLRGLLSCPPPLSQPLLDYFAGATQFFLNLGMASAKALLDPTSGIPGCSLLTAMSRNGVEFAIRVSGTGDRWFRAPAPVAVGALWPPFQAEDANPDIGDSAIVETAGLGAFVLAGAPAVHLAVGCSGSEHALALQQEMRLITAAQNPFFLVSPADGTGSPFGIDVCKVVATGITPAITTGIAHRRAGVGMIGAGIVRAPIDCFTATRAALEPLETAARGVA